MKLPPKSSIYHGAKSMGVKSVSEILLRCLSASEKSAKRFGELYTKFEKYRFLSDEDRNLSNPRKTQSAGLEEKHWRSRDQVGRPRVQIDEGEIYDWCDYDELVEADFSSSSDGSQFHD
jgi:hypothetical protein